MPDEVRSGKGSLHSKKSFSLCFEYVYDTQYFTPSPNTQGSCTLKLNATSQLIPVSMAEFNSLHPFIPEEQAVGYQELLEELERDLCEITGYDKFSFQANR